MTTITVHIPDYTIPITQAILKASGKGVTRSELINSVTSLKEQGDEKWINIPMNKLPNRIDEATKYLLRRVMIRKDRGEEDDTFFPRE